MAKELLSYRLNSIHNLYFYTHLMENARRAILAEKYADFMHNFYESQEIGLN
jgi:queuine tRNA-ribosyltransferase